MTDKANKLLRALLEQVSHEAVENFRNSLVQEILIGPVDSLNHDDGFAIFIKGFRIGWWRTREEACDAAKLLETAITGK